MLNRCILCNSFSNVNSQHNNNNKNVKIDTNNANNKAATTTTVVRAKEILGEAADAVANSFAKSSNQQGMNKGREKRKQ